MEDPGPDSRTPLLEGAENSSEEESPQQEALVDQHEPDVLSNASTVRRRNFYRRTASLMLSPVTDEVDSLSSVLVGLLTMFLIGGLLGLVMPVNDALPTAWYRTVSSMIGYTFFVMWSISFYPQVLNNFRRRTTHGLSADFCGLNVLGFGCYSVYNGAMFYSHTIHEEYRQRHGAHAEITVQSNDVAFAVNAFLLASITFVQIGYYDGFGSQRPSRTIETFIVAFLLLALVYPLLVLTGMKSCNWLNYLYLLSYVKVAITLIKYMPQVVLNFQRKSTTGFSIWQILLDFGGGVLSDLQLILDSAGLQDWSGVLGNPAKLCLGLVSIVFDIIFMVQHYVLYRTSTTADESLHRDDDLNAIVETETTSEVAEEGTL